MIRREELRPVGKLLKTHGVNGELVVWLDVDADLGVPGHCVVLDIDGIYVPFFPVAVRPKSADTDLLTLDGVTNDREAAALCGKTLFLLASEMAATSNHRKNKNVGTHPGASDTDESTGAADDDDDDDHDEQRLYADELVGFRVTSPDGRLNGEIIDVDDTTVNLLLVIRTDADSKTVLLPPADEFILSLDPQARTIEIDPPAGLLDL